MTRGVIASHVFRAAALPPLMAPADKWLGGPMVPQGWTAMRRPQLGPSWTRWTAVLMLLLALMSTLQNPTQGKGGRFSAKANKKINKRFLCHTAPSLDLEGRGHPSSKTPRSPMSSLQISSCMKWVNELCHAAWMAADVCKSWRYFRSQYSHNIDLCE